MQTVMVIFIQAKYVLATFVNIRNILAVTDPMLTKFFGPTSCSTHTFLDPNIFWTQQFFFLQNFLDPKIFLIQILSSPKSFFCPKSLGQTSYFYQMFLFFAPIFFAPKFFGPKIFVGSNIFITSILCHTPDLGHGLEFDFTFAM